MSFMKCTFDKTDKDTPNASNADMEKILEETQEEKNTHSVRTSSTVNWT